MVDRTKYIFQGGSYSKGRLVLEVIKAYVKSNTGLSYEQLMAAFPKKIQGSLGCFILADEARKIASETGHKRHFIDAKELVELNSGMIAICSQWGVGNIQKFLLNAKSLGYTIGDDLDQNAQRPANNDANRPFFDMPLTEMVWLCFSRAEIEPEVGWSDERDMSQFKIELEISEVDITIFVDVNESAKTVDFYGYYSKRIEIKVDIKNMIEMAVAKANRILSFGAFNLIEGSLIQFAVNIDGSKTSITNDILDASYTSVWSNMNAFNSFLLSVASGALDVDGAWWAVVDFGGVFNPKEQASTSGIFIVQFRQSVVMEFENILNATRFEKDRKAQLEFNIEECSDENETLHLKPVKDFPVALSIDNINIERKGATCFTEFVHTFEVSVNPDKSVEDLEEWIQERGGIYCFRIELIDNYCDFGDGETYLGNRNTWGFELDASDLD